MKFRSYQERFVTNIGLMLRRARKVVGQLATGGGKTVVFSGITKQYIEENPYASVLILVHRKKLLKQTRKTLYNAFGIECQVIIAGMKHIPFSRAYVGMVESVIRRLDRLHNIGLVIIDECHIASFNKILPNFPTQKIIGFTATPLANSKKHPLKGYYEDIVCGVDIPELIQEKALCQNVTFAPQDIVDRAALSVSTNGDFKEGLMGVEFSKPRYVKNVVDAYEKYSPRTKAIIFNVTIEHSKLVCNAFIGAGYNCKHIDSEMGEMEQTHIYNWFETTPGAILCNVGMATTGVDIPSIETVIVNRATMSMPLWLQMCGRGSRPSDNKLIFTIIDLGGNAVSHGDWCDARDWYDIFHNPPKPGEPKDQPAPVKICPSCEAVIPAQSKQCKYCLYIFPAKQEAAEDNLGALVVVTKGIDVKELIAKNRDKKKYVAFYDIGKILAKNAKDSIKEMTDETAAYILERYIEKALDWAKEYNHKIAKWHHDEAKKTLYDELQKHFKKWKPNTRPINITPYFEEAAIQKQTQIIETPDFSTFDSHFKNML